MALNDRLNDPYRGAAGDSHLPDGTSTVLPVTLDGHSYLIDTSRQSPAQEQFRRSSVQLLNTQQNIDEGESALTPPEVWRRTYTSWHHGAGQKVADRPDSDRNRFNWSKGVDVWTPWQFGLLHDVERVADASVRGGLLCNGITVAQQTDRRNVILTDGGGRIAARSLPAAGEIVTDGYHLYLLDDADVLHTFTVRAVNNLLTITEIGTGTQIPAIPPCDLLVFANYRLVACTSDGAVYDITKWLGQPAAPETTIAPVKDPLVQGFRWRSGCAGRNVIYLLGGVGDKYTLHSLTPDPETDALLYSGQSAELPDGEIGYAVYSYLGYVAIGSSKGFRFAASSPSDASVTYGPLLATDSPVRCFEGQGRFLYYGLESFRGDSGVGRADLSTFTSDLQPAYTSDLLAEGREGEPCLFINTLPNGKLLFGLGGGLWVEQDTYVDEGQLHMSVWTFNVVDRKTGLYVDVRTTAGGDDGGKLEIFYDDDTEPLFIGDVVRPGATTGRYPLGGRIFNDVSLLITLSSPPSRLTTPLLYSAELRATYVRGKSSEWQVPCILHDEIELDNGTVTGRDVVADYQHLLSLVESGRQFRYIEEGQEWTVHATDFIWSPHERSALTGWQGVFTLYFREIR